MPEVSSEIIIKAAPAAVYALAKQVETFPEFLPNVQSVTILEREGQRTVSEWVGLIPEFKRTIRWVEEDYWDESALSCRFRLLSGDWDRYEGVWTFEPLEESENPSTRVRLAIDYDYNVPLIGPLIKKLLQKLVTRNAEEILQGLQRRMSEAL